MWFERRIHCSSLVRHSVCTPFAFYQQERTFEQTTTRSFHYEIMIIPKLLIFFCLGIIFEARGASENLDFTDHSNGSPLINRSSYFKQDFRLGYKLKLFCESSGNPRPSIVWYHRGVEVNPDHNRTIRFSIHGSTTASYLEIDPTSIGDKGEYECVASNSKGSIVKKFLTDYQY